jgi:iron-sulfur cluster assembly protein
MMRVTAAAVRQVLAAAQASDAAGLALRVAARRLPDGSVDYALGFDEPRQGDLAVEQEGVDLLIGPPSQALLEGTTLDFVEYEPGQFRFILISADEPPGAEGGGCGGCDACGSKP